MIFAALIAILLPFPWQLASFQQHFLPSFLGKDLYRSDSSAQLVLYGACLLIAVPLALLPLWRKRPTLTAYLHAALLGWLALVLMRYGADKVFKTQFYLPEPTTLYTPFGMLERDTLYWSTVGLSRSYNIFLGITELLAAFSLPFHRTRRLGLLLSATVFIQVLAVDLCFGIDVRLFAAFLLVLTGILLLPDARHWIRFLSGRAADALQTQAPAKSRVRSVLKGLLILVMLLEGLLPLLRGGTWNDDAAPRPPLHGAYQVTGGSLPGLPAAKRILVHRAGYMVLQDSADGLHPFELSVNPGSRTFDLHVGSGWQRYSFRLGNDSVLTVQTSTEDTTTLLRARALSWRSLPAFR